MIRQQLATILWLRWRISYNQWRRAGRLNAILTVMFSWFLLFSSVALFLAALIGGIIGLSYAQPDHVLIIWDVIVSAFFFMWIIGLLTELQRSELLSLEKLLHLPISLSGAFLLNYLTSLASLRVIMLFPAMLGLCLASVVTHGPAMLLMFPLVIAFMLLVTALTYQLRGWLAMLMANKRRRRTVVAAVTVSVILLCQVPNMINLAFQSRRKRSGADKPNVQAMAADELKQKRNSGELTREEYEQQLDELNKRRDAFRKLERTRTYNRVVYYLNVGNLVIPFGWLPYSAAGLAKGIVVPAVLTTIGMSLLGGVSLWRSYHTTLRFYTGQRKIEKRIAKPQPPQSPNRRMLLETRLPCFSEHASAVAAASLQSLLRAPEGKMVLVTPVILICVFGSTIVFGVGHEMPLQARPFVGVGVLAMTMFGISQLMVNVFGFDRNGFRAYMLMPVSRRDVLVGKNAAVAPIAFGMSVVMLAVLQMFLPQHFTHLVATLVQFVPVFLLYCLIGNTASIAAPVGMSAGSVKPVQPKAVPMLIQMLALFCSPLVLVPPALWLGAELLLQRVTGVTVVPLYLLLSLGEAALAIWLYRRVVTAQARWLFQREPRILQAVSSLAE